MRGDDAGAHAEHLRPILIRRTQFARRLTVYVTPIRALVEPTADHMLNRTRAVVLVIDAEAGQPPDPPLVRDVVGLTWAEPA